MARHSHRHRSTTLPFAYRDSGLNFEFEQYSVDDEKPTDLDLMPGQTEINFATLLDSAAENQASDWQKMTLCGELTVPEETVEAVFPESERGVPPAKLYVAIRCHETIYRDRKIISEAPTRSGTYELVVQLYRDDLRGSVEFCPYLVRTTESGGLADDRYATDPNFRVASGRTYTAVVDLPDDEEPPAIDGEEVSFSRHTHLPEGNKLYYLDFRNESRPKLWINSDHPRITDVLQSRGSVGAEPRMRDVVLDQISYGVWTQLILRAGSAIHDDGVVDYEWQRTIVETFARNLYDVDDLSESIRRLQNDIDDPEGLPHLMERIDRELQEYIDPRTQLINLMEEGLQI